MKHTTKSHMFFSANLFLLCLLCAGHLSAQIFNPFPCTDALTLPPGCPGKNYELNFQLVGPAGNWQITSGNLPQGLTLNVATGAIGGTISSGATGTANFSLARGGATGTFSLPLFLSTDAICQAPGSFNVGPCNREIVYVLDRSGSMAWPSEPGSATSRWAKMRQVIAANLATMGAILPNLNANDEWEVIFFDSGVTRSVRGNFMSVPNIDAIMPPAMLPSGWTALGAGFQFALSRAMADKDLPGNGKKRMLLMISDGEQNRNPQVNTTNYSQIACDPPGQTPSQPPTGVTAIDNVDAAAVPALCSATAFDINAGTNSSVTLYSVGIGTSMGLAGHDLLNGVRGSYASTLGVADLTSIANNITSEWLASSGSPRILESHKSNTGIIDNVVKAVKLPASDGVEPFIVNAQVEKIVLQFFATDQAFVNSEVQVFKDGNLVRGAQIVLQPHLRLWTLDLTSAKTLEFNPWLKSPNAAKGVWTAIINDFTKIPYQFTAFVEDKRLHQGLSIGNGSKLYVGDPLTVRANLDLLGKGLTGAKAKAYLVRPGDDIGDVTANAPTPNDLKPLEPGGSLGQAKIEYVAGQKEYFDRLMEKELGRVIDLVDDGKGNYTGTFTETEITGGYRVVVRFLGELGAAIDSNYFQGWVMEGAFFDFGRPEDIRLERSVETITDKNGTRYVVKFTPVNKFGKKLGPGNESRIKVNSSIGTVGPLKDNLDGSYSAVVSTPVGIAPDISIFVIDQVKPVYVGPAVGNGRAPNKGLAFSLHAGATAPANDLNTLVDPGVFAELDLTYRFKNNFDVEAVGGYYGFSNDFNITGAALHLGYLFGQQTNGLWLRGAAGIGVYKPQNINSTVGYAARLEFGKPISEHLELALQGTYTYLADPKWAYFTGGLGLKYFF